jgi:cell division protein FtsB
LTTKPASSREGKTLNAPGATAKLKKQAAPNHKTNSKIRKLKSKFINARNKSYKVKSKK